MAKTLKEIDPLLYELIGNGTKGRLSGRYPTSSPMRPGSWRAELDSAKSLGLSLEDYQRAAAVANLCGGRVAPRSGMIILTDD